MPPRGPSIVVITCRELNYCSVSGRYSIDPLHRGSAISQWEGPNNEPCSYAHSASLVLLQTTYSSLLAPMQQKKVRTRNVCYVNNSGTLLGETDFSTDNSVSRRNHTSSCFIQLALSLCTLSYLMIPPIIWCERPFIECPVRSNSRRSNNGWIP